MYYQGRRRTYQELVFWEDPESAVPRLTEKLNNTITEISNTNATPIICTIPPAVIHKWNETRLTQNKTCTLKYADKYSQMQRKLTDTLIEINRHIININTTNNVHTPKLADTILRKKGRGKGYRLFDKKLGDGVHADEDTRKIWAKQILEAILQNRSPLVQMPPGLPVQVPNVSNRESDPETEPNPKKVKTQ